MAQYPIPQFIEKEGRIISFLTFRQFFWLIGGGIACVAIYFLYLPFFIFAICVIIIAGVVAIGAFVKINNMSATQAILSFVKFSTGTKNYTWAQKKIPHPFKIAPLPQQAIEAEPKTQELKLQNSKLKEVKRLIETKK